MIEIELEKTYLAKALPQGLEACPHKEVYDIYVPAAAAHPTLRLRKKGDKYEMTKKYPVMGADASEHEEHTIRLSKEEFEDLACAPGKRVRKIRYEYMHEDMKAEVDVFLDDLEGLVLVDFEFASSKEKAGFEMPDFCLVEVTLDEKLAGGMLCGKKYADIEGHLEELGYEPIRQA